MTNELYITSYVRFTNSGVLLNGENVNLFPANTAMPEMLKTVYRSLDLKYPKFFKMDNLCKLAFLSAEYLLKDNELSGKYGGENVAVILSNASSSLNTDLNHHSAISDKNNFFPSPAVFVYTLPNITIGEICIRHKIKGENNFFCSDKFSPDILVFESKRIFDENKASAIICGWTEMGMDGTIADSVMFTLENDININHNNFLKFEKDNLNKLYNKTE